MKKLLSTIGLLMLLLVVTSFTTPTEIGGGRSSMGEYTTEIGGGRSSMGEYTTEIGGGRSSMGE
jgi:hypothetical protein